MHLISTICILYGENSSKDITRKMLSAMAGNGPKTSFRQSISHDSYYANVPTPTRNACHNEFQKENRQTGSESTVRYDMKVQHRSL